MSLSTVLLGSLVAAATVSAQAPPPIVPLSPQAISGPLPAAPMVLEAGTYISAPAAMPQYLPYGSGVDVFCHDCGAHPCSKPTNGYGNQQYQLVRKWADSHRQGKQFFQGDAWLMRYEGTAGYSAGGNAFGR